VICLDLIDQARPDFFNDDLPRAGQPVASETTHAHAVFSRRVDAWAQAKMISFCSSERMREAA